MRSNRYLPRRIAVLGWTLTAVLTLGGCGDGAGDAVPARVDDSAAAGASRSVVEEGDYFTIDEEAGTVTHQDGTHPIAARGTLSVEGERYDFVTTRCPIPESAAVEDLRSWVGYGLAPDGRPFYVNSARNLAFNITYDPDWSSTDTQFDEYKPDWTIEGDQLVIEEFEVKDTERNERVMASIVVRCL